MKILHLIYTHGIAGAEKYLRHLLPPLQKENISSHLILVCAPGFEKKLQEYAVELNALGIPCIVLIHSKTGFFTAAKKIAAYTRQHQIQFLHSHLINSDILAILVKFFYNKNLVLISTKHGYSEQIVKQITDADNLGGLKYKARLKPYYYIAWLTLKLIPNNFAVSRAMSRVYQQLGFTKTAMPYIYHGVTVPVAVNNEGKLAQPQLIIIGRLELVKGHFYLLKAMPAIIAQYPSCKLLILGEGSERVNLERIARDLGISNNVEFMGFQPNPYPYIQQSDLVIIPSLFEPFGLVFIEALALQKTIVAFDVAAGNEILSHLKTAVLVNKADAKQLEKNILNLLQNKALNETIAQNGFQHYNKCFTTGVMIESTKKYYLSLVHPQK